MDIDELRKILREAARSQTTSLSIEFEDYDHLHGPIDDLLWGLLDELRWLAPHLRQLTLSGSPHALPSILTDLTPLTKLTNLQELDISNTEVSDLGPLGELTSLHALYINNTQVSDLAPLAKLTNLQELDIGYTEVSDLTPLAKLTNLVILDARCKQVSDLSPLARLTSLWHLDVSFTRVSDLKPLAKLASLQELDVGITRVSDLTPLTKLAGLRKLDVYGTPVSDLAPLAKLTSLLELDASGTQVSDLTPLTTLTRLQVLNIGDARLRLTIFRHIFAFHAFEDIRGSQVSDLTPLASLTRLQVLDISGTKVSNLLPLEKLISLHTLDLSGCKITDTELEHLVVLANLDLLAIENTAVKGIAPELIESHDAKVILEAWQAGVELGVARIAMVGMGNVGKTWLLRRCFMDEVIDPTTEARNATHDIDLVRRERVKWKPQVARRDGRGQRTIEPRIWDFGGQLVKHGVHEPFLSADGRTVYVLVLSARRVPQRAVDHNGHEAGNGLDYWLKTLGHFAGPSAAVLIAVTQCDEYHRGQRRPIDEPMHNGAASVIEQKADDLSAQTGACVVAPVIDGCSACLDDESAIQPLRAAIEHALAQLSSLDEKVPEGLKKLKTKVERELAGQALIEMDQFYRWCGDCGIGDADRQDTYLRVLHHMGSLFYFGLTRREQRKKEQSLPGNRREDWLGGYPRGQRRLWSAERDPMLEQYIINPHWLKWTVYEVIDQSEREPWQTKGKIDRTIHNAPGKLNAPRFEARPQGPAVVHAFLKLTDLCHYEETKECYLFPRGLPQSGLGLSDGWRKVIAHWNYLPEATFHRFLVRLHQRGNVAQDETGISLHRRWEVVAFERTDPTVRVAIRATPEVGTLEFRFDPQADQAACVKLAEKLYDLFREDFMGGREPADVPLWPGKACITKELEHEAGEHPRETQQPSKQQVGRPVVMTRALVEIFQEIDKDWQDAKTGLKTEERSRVVMKHFWTPDRRKGYQERYENDLNTSKIDLTQTTTQWLSEKMKQARKKKKKSQTSGRGKKSRGTS